MNLPPESTALQTNGDMSLKMWMTWWGQVVVTMVVRFGQALLYSEASLPVVRAWIFSCWEKLHVVKSMASNLDHSCLAHPPTPGLQVCAPDSTKMVPARLQKVKDNTPGTSKQNHAWLLFNPYQPWSCLLTPRKPAHQLLVSLRRLCSGVHFWVLTCSVSDIKSPRTSVPLR